MVIRRAEERDVGKIGELLLQVGKVHSDGRPDLFKRGGRKYNDEEVKNLLNREDRRIFLAEEGGAVKGYVFCEYDIIMGSGIMADKKNLYIDDLCVDEKHRREGVGERLLAYVEDFAKSEKFDRITLNVWSCNEGAIKFYLKKGFTPYKTGMEKRV